MVQSVCLNYECLFVVPIWFRILGTVRPGGLESFRQVSPHLRIDVSGVQCYVDSCGFRVVGPENIGPTFPRTTRVHNVLYRATKARKKEYSPTV